MTKLPDDLKNIIEGYQAKPMTFFQNKTPLYLNRALAGFEYYQQQVEEKYKIKVKGIIYILKAKLTWAKQSKKYNAKSYAQQSNKTFKKNDKKQNSCHLQQKQKKPEKSFWESISSWLLQSRQSALHSEPLIKQALCQKPNCHGLVDYDSQSTCQHLQSQGQRSQFGCITDVHVVQNQQSVVTVQNDSKHSYTKNQKKLKMS